MSHKIKAFGIILIAALALSAVGSPAATATFSFTAPEGAVTATGNQIGEAQNVFTFNHGALKCNKVEFSGTQSSPSSTDITITPHYTECVYLGLNATVDFQGCVYTFTTPTVKIKPGEYTGEPFHLVCPEGKETKVQPKIGGITQCTIFIPAQTPTSGHVIYKNLGAGATRDFTLEFTITGIHYKSDKDFCATPINTTLVDGTYIGGITLKAYKDPTSPINTHTEANHRAITIE